MFAERARWTPWLAAALVLLVGIWAVDALPVGVMRDDGMYVILARSLATGRGYRWLNLPGTPIATHFPPGYPALLALVWQAVPAFPANVVAFKFVNVALGALIALQVVRFATSRFGFSSVAASVIAVVAAVSVPVLSLVTAVMSEPLFLALALGALLAAERVADGDGRLSMLIVMGALAGVATLVRAHGIALVAAVVLVLALRRRVRDAAIAGAMSLLLIVPWQVYAAAHDGVLPAPMRGNYESYGRWLASAVTTGGPSFVARTIGRNVWQTGAVLAQAVVPWGAPVLRFVIALAVLALVVAGARTLWRRAPVTALFLAFYMAIVLVWPFSPSRFMWGVWPLIVFIVIVGGRELVVWATSSAAPARRTAFAALGALALVYAVTTSRAIPERAWSFDTRAQASLIAPVVVWAAEHTPSDAVLAANYEYSVFLYSGRQAVPLTTFTAEQFLRPRTTEQNAEAMREIVAHYRPEAVLISVGFVLRAADVLASRRPPVIARADSAPGVIVFRPLPDLRASTNSASPMGSTVLPTSCASRPFRSSLAPPLPSSARVCCTTRGRPTSRCGLSSAAGRRVPTAAAAAKRPSASACSVSPLPCSAATAGPTASWPPSPAPS